MADSIEKLRVGDTLYSYARLAVNEYLFIFYQEGRDVNKNVYIFLDVDSNEPIKLDRLRVESILEQGLKSRKEASLALADYLEDCAHQIKRRNGSVLGEGWD